MLMPRLLAIALIALLAGCGGGSASSLLPPTAKAATGTATFVIRIPQSSASAASSARKPAYVSPGTQSFAIWDGVSANYLAVWQTTPTAPNCALASGVLTCTESLVMAPGWYALNAYEFATPSPTPPSSMPSPLASNSVTFTVVAGATASVPVVMNGDAATTTITPPSPLPSLVAGTPAVVPLNIVVKDASGNPITGPGKINNIGWCIAYSTAAPHLFIGVNGSAASDKSVPGGGGWNRECVYNPPAGAAFSLVYDGVDTADTALIQYDPSNTQPMTTISVASGPSRGSVNVSPSAATFLTALAGAQTIHVDVPGWTNSAAGSFAAPFGNTMTVLPSTNCAGIASISAGAVDTNGQAFTVTPQSTGTCNVYFSDLADPHSNPTGQLTVQVL